jgi:hypothetical protein
MWRRIRLLLAALTPLMLVGGYSVSRVECPYCHDSDANRKGACDHRERWGYCREDVYAEHYNKATCPWCRGTGAMRGWEAMMD